MPVPSTFTTSSTVSPALAVTSGISHLILPSCTGGSVVVVVVVVSVVVVVVVVVVVSDSVVSSMISIEPGSSSTFAVMSILFSSTTVTFAHVTG